MARTGLPLSLRGSLSGLLLVSVGCGDSLVASPFEGAVEGLDAGAPDGGVGPDAGLPGPDAPRMPEILFGAPCVDDVQCDDGIDCTLGVCDPEFGVCRFTGDDARCDDGVYCNGVERCEPRRGCRPGPPTSCSDATPCTIDSCDEAMRACVRRPRDADGDGDIDANCQPGGDCNDFDPAVSSQAAELCNNAVDDDCDAEVDELDCQAARFDTCADAFAVSAPGSYLVPSAGAALDYASGCAPAELALRDLVLEVSVPAGPPVDIDLLVRTALGELALASVDSCGAAPAELDCTRGVYLPSGENAARLRLRSVTAGAHSIHLLTSAGAPIQLEVEQLPATPVPPNRDCSEALELEPDEPLRVDLALGGPGIESTCSTERADLFYTFTLAQAADVRLAAQSLDELGEPRLSLRGPGCEEETSELSCNQATVALLHHHSLAAGTYAVALSASGPTQASLVLELGPPTPPPATDQCSGAPAVPPGRVQEVSFIDHLDDIAANCTPGLIDAAWALDLAEPSDVLLLGRFSVGDVGSVALVDEACGAEDARECSRPGANPARVSELGVPAGRYRALVESALGLPATLTAAVRPARARTLVPTSDACLEALTIGPDGGFFQGNTLNAENDFSASCDFATPNGAPDQLLRLVLDRPRRVLFDMRGSDFDTLLNLRQGPECPGQERVGACAVGVAEDQSFLDLELPAGEYFLQIDGYAGALGSWFLDVFLMDP